MKPTVLNTTPIYEGKVYTVGSIKNSSILKSIVEATFWVLVQLLSFGWDA